MGANGAPSAGGGGRAKGDGEGAHQVRRRPWDRSGSQKAMEMELVIPMDGNGSGCDERVDEGKWRGVERTRRWRDVVVRAL